MKIRTLQYSEAALAEGILKGSPLIFNYIHSHYRSILKWKIRQLIGLRYTSHAEDLLQETFYKMFLYRNTYNFQKSLVYTWMHSIAKNTAIDFLRSKYAKSISLESPIRLEDCDHYQEIPVISTRLDAKNLLTSLKEQDSKIIQLKFYYGLTSKEVAQMLSVPIWIVKTKIRAIYHQFQR